jgi:hypothetical protein
MFAKQVVVTIIELMNILKHSKQVAIFMSVALTVAAFFVLGGKTAMAKGEVYQWQSDGTTINVVSGNYFVGRSFKTNGFTVPKDSAKNKIAKVAGGSIINMKSNNCAIYPAIKFLDDAGTSAQLIRYDYGQADADECPRKGDWYNTAFLDLPLPDISLTITTATGPAGPAGPTSPSTVGPSKKSDTPIPLPSATFCSENSELKVIPGFADLCDISTYKDSTKNPLSALIQFVVNIVMGVVAIIIATVIVISGIEIASSAGDPERLKKGKSRIVAAITSLVLLVSMTAIFNLIGFSG